MANAITLINLFCAFGLSVSLECTDNLWSPCGGDTARDHSLCNHNVSKVSVIQGMNSIILGIKSLHHEETQRLNMVPLTHAPKEKPKGGRTCRSPGLRRKVKIKKKIEYIHETFADLVFVHRMMETIFENLTLDKEIMSNIKNTMCHLYQANRSLQCRKNGKTKKNMKTFDRTVQCRKKSCFRLGRRTALRGMKKAIKILNKTTVFWKNSVKDNLILKRKRKHSKKRKRRKSRQNTEKR